MMLPHCKIHKYTFTYPDGKNKQNWCTTYSIILFKNYLVLRIFKEIIPNSMQYTLQCDYLHSSTFVSPLGQWGMQLRKNAFWKYVHSTGIHLSVFVIPLELSLEGWDLDRQMYGRVYSLLSQRIQLTVVVSSPNTFLLSWVRFHQNCVDDNQFK
jgi:hypothetical protein